MPTVESIDPEWKQQERESTPLEERELHFDLKSMVGAGGIQSPFLSEVHGEALETAESIQAERSARARTVDDLYNAPVPETFSEWANAPNRYDLPGVDTVSYAHRLARAEDFLARAERAGAVDEVNLENRRLKKNKGKHTARMDPREDDQYHQRVTTKPKETLDEESAGFGSLDFPTVLAHEVGHAADFFAGGKAERDYESERVLDYFEASKMFDDPKAGRKHQEQARRLSERIRGSFSTEDAYRNDLPELAADTLSSMVTEPRAARREAPDLYDAFEERIMGRLEEPGR